MDCFCFEILLIYLCCFHGTLDGRHLQNYNESDIKTNALISKHRSQRDFSDIESRITFPESKISEPASKSTEEPENRNLGKTNYDKLDESRIVFPDDNLPRLQKHNNKNDETTNTMKIETSTVNNIDMSYLFNTKTEFFVNNLPITKSKFQDDNTECRNSSLSNNIICKSLIESISSLDLNYSPELKPIGSVIASLSIENANLPNNAISNKALNNFSIEDSTIKAEDGTILQSSISNIPISNSNLQNNVIVSAPISNTSINKSYITQYSDDIGSALSNLPILNSTIQNSVIKSTPVATLNLSHSIITSKVPVGNAISDIKISNSQLQGLNIVSNPTSKSTVSDSIFKVDLT